MRRRRRCVVYGRVIGSKQDLGAIEFRVCLLGARIAMDQADLACFGKQLRCSLQILQSSGLDQGVGEAEG
jgi:hypothetical protein